MSDESDATKRWRRAYEHEVVKHAETKAEQEGLCAEVEQLRAEIERLRKVEAAARLVAEDETIRGSHILVLIDALEAK